MREMLKYDFFYLKRTSKFIVFPLVIIVFSILSPLTARYLNELLDLLLGSTDIGLNFPDPTVYDSYLQYYSDLNEIVLFVILFTAVSIFIRDKTKGLMPLILSKPINRDKYYLSKFISFSVLIFGSLLIGYLVFTYYTYFLFDEVFFGVGLIMILLYFVYILFLLSITLFTSVVFKSYVGSIASAFGIYIFVSILSVFDEVSTTPPPPPPQPATVSTIATMSIMLRTLAYFFSIHYLHFFCLYMAQKPYCLMNLKD